jgi:hypothetical protein
MEAVKDTVAEIKYHHPKNSERIYIRRIFTPNALPPEIINLMIFMSFLA